MTAFPQEDCGRFYCRQKRWTDLLDKIDELTNEKQYKEKNPHIRFKPCYFPDVNIFKMADRKASDHEDKEKRQIKPRDLSSIKNKIHRSELYQKEKHLKNKEKKVARTKRKRERQEAIKNGEEEVK